MRKPFNGDFVLTQGWGLNPEIYKQFIVCNKSLLGHNGIDWALPSGTSVLSPHEGKITEAQFDPGGFGFYVKLENKIEGSVLAHLESFSVKVGDNVKEGKIIGLSDNTGFSTGAHLHWGYYRQPRNRCDGYGGFCDPFPYLGGEVTMPENTVAVEKPVFENLVKKSTQRDDLFKYLEISDPDDASYDDAVKVIAGIKSDKTACNNRLDEQKKEVILAQTEVTNKESEISRVRDDMLKERDRNNTLQTDTLKQKEQYEGRIAELLADKDELGKQIGRLQRELAVAQGGVKKSFFQKLIDIFIKY